MYQRLVSILCPFLLGSAAMAQSQRIDPDTGAETWETQTQGVTVSLTQILPDQARAFYLNRGFPRDATERFATSCVFMTVLRNDTAPGRIHFRLADWTVMFDGERRHPIGLEDWLDTWQGYDISPAALLAFRWAQFPAEQEFEPGGDWNQGMLSTGLAPGAEFNLHVKWDVTGTSYETILENVECAH